MGVQASLIRWGTLPRSSTPARFRTPPGSRRPAPNDRGERGDYGSSVQSAQCAHLGCEPFPESLDGRRARFDQQLAIAIAADVEPQEVEPLGEGHDPCLVLVEDKPTGCQPLGELGLDLFGLLSGVSADDQVVGVADHNRAARPDRTGVPAGGLISDSCGLLQPMERHVQHQRAEHAALGSSLLSRCEGSVFDHPGFQPAPDHVPGGKRPERVEKPEVVDVVERRRQVGVYDPCPPAVALQGGEQRGDRIGAATARPKPIRLGFQPGLPLGLQRMTDPCLVAAVREHGNAERATFSVGLWYIHAPDRHGLPGGDRLVHPARHLCPGRRRQRELPVDPGGPAPSVALRDLPHADQRVRPGPQHQLLQRPDLGPVSLLRRLEDFLPQPPYVVLMGPPLDGVPVRHVFGSVHRHGVQLAPSVRKAYQHQRSKAHLPTSAPFRAQPPGLVSGQLSQTTGGGPITLSWVSCRLSATGIGFLGILFPPGTSAPLTVGLPGIAWTPTGFPRSTHPRCDRIGRPLHPEAQRCSHDRSDLSGRRSPPLPAARPCHPGPHPTLRSCPLRGIIKGSLTFARPVFPLTRSIPWMGQGPLGFFPGLRTPQAEPAAHARAGDGHRALARSYTSDIVGPPFRKLTRSVRPRVAGSGWTWAAFPPPPTLPPGPATPLGSSSQPARPRATAPPGTATPTWPGCWARRPWPPGGPTPSSGSATGASPGGAAPSGPSSRSAVPS